MNPHPSPLRRPMLLEDQHGWVNYGWFRPETPTDPAHILPAVLDDEVCRAAGLDPRSPWAEFPTAGRRWRR